MFPKYDFSPSAADASKIAAMRQELREIARALRELAAGTLPRAPDLLPDDLRAKVERIQLRRAA
jgi:hypothetical protein